VFQKPHFSNAAAMPFSNRIIHPFKFVFCMPNKTKRIVLSLPKGMQQKDVASGNGYLYKTIRHATKNLLNFAILTFCHQAGASGQFLVNYAQRCFQNPLIVVLFARHNYNTTLNNQEAK